ncbi:MAG: manganese efflux pump [candidate division Zixibacteria bacterium]|nr:manganese efflux pump [candidate division Zixibacteria bacterium]
MDCFAVAIAVGSTQPKLSPRRLFRLSWHFGLFQLLLTVVGWYLGSGISQYIHTYDHWLAFGLLAYVGVRMIRESISTQPDRRMAPDPTRGWTLIILSIATSIDAFAVGLSMAFLGVLIWMPSAVIGAVTVVMTIVGMLFGRTLGAAFGKRMTLIGGIILIGIGVKIVINHLAV